MNKFKLYYKTIKYMGISQFLLKLNYEFKNMIINSFSSFVNNHYDKKVEKSDQANLIELSRNINDSMPEFVVKTVKEKLFGIGDPKIAILGITYKGNVDDLRESPLLDVIDIFEKEEIEFSIHDPYVESDEMEISDLEKAVDGADCIILGADHREFSKIDIERVSELMENKIVFDTKNFLNAEKWQEYGFKYYKIGDYSNNDWHKDYGVNNRLSNMR